MAAHLAMYRDMPVLLGTSEMTREEITLRLLAAEARVPLTALLRRELDDSYWTRIAKARNRIAESKLVIDYAPDCSLAPVRSPLRGLARRGPGPLAGGGFMQLLPEA